MSQLLRQITGLTLAKYQSLRLAQRHSLVARMFRDKWNSQKIRTRLEPRLALETLEHRVQLDAGGATSQPVAMWVERDNGDDAFYSGVINYAVTDQPLAAKKLLLRLGDPDSADPSIKPNFQLNANSRLIRTINQLSQQGFNGEIALIPDIEVKTPWNWKPFGSSIVPVWQAPFYWAQQANQILVGLGSKLHISEVTLEMQSCGIPATTDTLNSIRAYEQSLWPQMQADPLFVGSGMAHSFSNLMELVKWTNPIEQQPRLLDAAYCELYNMYKQIGNIEYVDAYAAGSTVNNPEPASPDTIYSLAAIANDPVATILGTPTASTPSSTFGYLVGLHSSEGMPADLSRTWLMLSAEKFGVGSSIINAFGTWDAPQAGPGAGVDEFQQFCQSMVKAFMPFWGSTLEPNICVFQHNLLPSTWVNPPLTSVQDPISTFDSWHFPLWDYRECGTDDATLTNYHQWLLGYLAEHPPKKLVLYVTDPSIAGGSYYDPTAAAPSGNSLAASNFVGFLQQLSKLNRRVPIEILMDRSSFPSTSPLSVPSNWTQMALNAPSPIELPTDWSNLPRGVSWLSTLMANPQVPAGVVSGLTIDPELKKDTQGSNVGSVAYENIACWLDWAKRQQPATTSLGIGMALEVDSQTFAKLNVMNFPPTPNTDLGNLSTNGNIPISHYLTDGYPTWRQGVSDPLLSMSYMEAYVGGSPNSNESNQPGPGAYYRWMNSNYESPVPLTPTQAANALQSSLIDIPYAPGKGTISVNGAVGNLTIQGTGTNFDQLEQFTAISTLTSTGSLDPATVPFFKVQDVKPGGTTISATGPAAAITQPRNWVFTELPMDWQAPQVPVGLENRVTFMFSAEKGQNLPFFGYWQLPQFLQFMTQASGLLASTNPNNSVFLTETGSGSGVPLTNYGLYSLRQICNAWNIATYPGSADVIAPRQPGVALLHDTGHESSDYITSDGRLQVTSEPGALVEFSQDGGLVWARSFIPREGHNDVLVRQTDAAGNQSQPSEFYFTLDTIRPAQPRVRLVGDTGPSGIDRLTRLGVLAPQGLEPDTKLQYWVNGSAWSDTYQPVEGRNLVRLRQVDKAGNVSRPGRPFRFRLDTVAAPVGVSLRNDTGSVSNDRVTTDGRLKITSIETGAGIQYSIDQGATWSRKFKPIVGSNSVLIRQIDRAGNVSWPTVISFVFESAAQPFVSLKSQLKQRLMGFRRFLPG